MTQERIKELFDYCKSGRLIERTFRSRNIVGNYLRCSSDKDGYLKCCVDKKYYRLHRLIYLWHFGYFPKIVDHKNRIVDDNKIENLRESCPSLNTVNSKRKNKYKGVKKRGNSYVAFIVINKKIKHIGTFKTDIDAAIAFDIAAKNYHGDFAALNF